MGKKKNLIAANWKMHKTIGEAVSFTEALQEAVELKGDREVVIAPPFVALSAVRQAMHKQDFALSGQNCHWEEKGAFTGEISCGMLKDAGCEYVIVGHSERRHLFGETDDMVKKKVAAALKHDLLPIVCIGEVLEQREEGRTFQVVGSQLDAALQDLGPQDARRVVVAYEPVWAIGTGRTATPEQAQEVHLFIRKRLLELFDKNIANEIRILYGGSVKPDNVDALMAQSEIDGLLVGGASLEVSSFARIVQYQITGGTN